MAPCCANPVMAPWVMSVGNAQLMTAQPLSAHLFGAEALWEDEVEVSDLRWLS